VCKIGKEKPRKVRENSLVENNPTWSTRNNLVHQENDLFVKPVRQTQSAQNSLIMVARIYKKLPEELKNEEDDKRFVGRLKKILKEHFFH
jgi:hypothetical protein